VIALEPRDATTVHGAFAAAAVRHPARAFLCVLDETASAYGIAAGKISYGAMLAEVSVLSRAYDDAGYVAGLRVGLLLENRPAFFRHWLALNALGISVVPINPDLRQAELAYLIGHSEMAAAVVLPVRHADLARAAAEADVDLPLFGPDDPVVAIDRAAPRCATPNTDTECALLYTSGTTGRPKGCVLTNTYYLNSGRWYLDQGGLMPVHSDGERMLTPLPLFHMNAMATSTMTMILAGGCLTVLDRFHPTTWWRSVRESRASIVHYLGVMPPMLMQAADNEDDRKHAVRFGFGAGIDRRLHATFEARFGFALIEAWAMTETGGGVVIAASHAPRHVGTSCFGKPGAECEVRILADSGDDAPPDTPGELLVRRAGGNPRAGFFACYLKDPEATAAAWADGWFHTGDMVRRVADGSLVFVDRKKNVIRRSGENISAVEVESVLLQHGDVAAVAVGAVPDEVRGDEVFACIVAKDLPSTRTARDALAQNIVAHCLERLAYYKAPGFIAFVTELPLTSTQKVQRGALKDLIAQRVNAPDTINTCARKKRVD
jgi:acyl-CoA synthetase (AMP-forming)/AMP-acid ligase II